MDDLGVPNFEKPPHQPVSFTVTDVVSPAPCCSCCLLLGTPKPQAARDLCGQAWVGGCVHGWDVVEKGLLHLKLWWTMGPRGSGGLRYIVQDQKFCILTCWYMLI